MNDRCRVVAELRIGGYIMFQSFFEFVGLTGKDADNVGEFLQNTADIAS